MASRTSATPGPGRGFTVPQVPKLLVYIVGFVPAAWLFYAGVNDELGADPMRYLEQSLGLWALRFLIGSLAVTPLRQSFGINLLRYRRAIGLLAFYYAALHLITYLVLDQGLDVSAIVADILKRPYITIGMMTFVILIPVAVTSNNLSIRKLGGQLWARIHKLVYVAAIGAALHFLLVVKSWPMEPLVYTAIVVALLGYRVVKSATRKPSPRRRAA
jgi:sulfoxide reductase heme-binding subunit YedZ